MTYSYQAQYADILSRLINSPLKKRPSRIGNTQSNFVEIIRVDLQKEFPLMDLKKIKFSNIVHELLWFIHGDTHIKYLLDNECGIWTDDAYRYYKEKVDKHNKANTMFPAEVISKEDFIKSAQKDSPIHGELDRVYGKQWREFNGKTDQLQNSINTLIKNPDDRRMIVSAHNPSDLEDEIVGLPSCHNMFQFYTVPLSFEERRAIAYENFPELKMLWQEKQLDEHDIPKFYLNVWFNIRSNDFFLGQPYNMPSYALLCHIVANIVNMIPSQVVCTAIDCHLYEAHIPAAQEFLHRYHQILEDNHIGETGIEQTASDVTYCQSKLRFTRQPITSIDSITADDIELVDYNPQSYIKAPLLT
jgi:thymidylate synthase